MSDLGQNATPVATTEAAPLKQVKKSELTAMVNEGKKRNEIAAHYGLKEAQVAKLLKAAGLKIRKFHLPTFELVDDTVEETAQMMDIPVTQEVLDMNPDLAAEGVQVGETIQVTEEATAEEVTAQVEAVTEEPAHDLGKGWSRTTQG